MKNWNKWSVFLNYFSRSFFRPNFQKVVEFHFWSGTFFAQSLNPDRRSKVPLAPQNYGYDHKRQFSYCFNVVFFNPKRPGADFAQSAQNFGVGRKILFFKRVEQTFFFNSWRENVQLVVLFASSCKIFICGHIRRLSVTHSFLGRHFLRVGKE